MNTSSQRGFSLAETLITVAVVGVLAAIGTLTISGVVKSTGSKKLLSDVDSLNRSVAAYIASGGDLSEAETADEVLAALKQSFSNASRIPGFSGAKVDERLSFTYQDRSEIQGKQWRAYWDPDQSRFVLAQSGKSAGIKAFAFDGEIASDQAKTYTPKTPLLYAENSSWIWDYKDAAASVSPGSSTLPITEVADTTPTPPTPPTGTGPSGSSSTKLTSPQFSITGGAYPVTSFSLPLTLLNPNPSGSSDLYYSVNFGNWSLYTGTIQISPDSVIAAQAVPKSDLYTSSAPVAQSYTALPADLLPPIITPSSPEFGLFTNRDVSITIADQNSSAISKIEYRIGGDPWQTYNSPFTLARAAYPSGTLVQARAVPKDPYYLASTATLRTLGVETASIDGNTVGSFSNPSGDVNMVTNLSGNTSNRFAWGREYYTQEEVDNFFSGDSNAAAAVNLSKSWLDYQAQSFNTVQPGKQFQIGTLNYFNGTIVVNTGATSVSFTANLDLKMKSVSTQASFDFQFELLNQPNYEDPNDPWRDADYVKLASPYASQTISFAGIEYSLQLEFGETSAAGLSLFDEFYVLEGMSASTRLYGTLIETQTIDFNN
jgi:prepilin-type N-terminal cleavage/methylation domain-containing protein